MSHIITSRDGAPKSLFASTDSEQRAPLGVLTRDEAQAVIERAVKLSKADAVRVSVQSNRETNLRFADNQLSTSTPPFACKVCSASGRPAW